MIDDIVGPDAAKHDSIGGFEDMLNRAQEHLESQARERAERRDQRSRGTKAQARREQAAMEVSQSVREVYRKLASALHPDRETDATERERKNALMQRANQAYERGDLLELLSMQISLIESDQGALARADDKRLQLYCQALREQQQALKQEIADVEAPIREGLDLAPGTRMPGRDAVLTLVSSMARNVKSNVEAARLDMAALLDPRRCGALIDQIPEPSAHEDALDVLAALMAAGMGAGMGAPRAARAKGRARKRR
jgi:hypothetical protein